MSVIQLDLLPVSAAVLADSPQLYLAKSVRLPGGFRDAGIFMPLGILTGPIPQLERHTDYIYRWQPVELLSLLAHMHHSLTEKGGT